MEKSTKILQASEQALDYLRKGKTDKWNEYVSKIRVQEPNAIIAVKGLRLDKVDFLKSSSEALDLTKIQLVNCQISNCIIRANISGQIITEGERRVTSIKNNIFTCSNIDAEFVLSNEGLSEKTRFRENDFLFSNINIYSQDLNLSNKIKQDIADVDISMPTYSCEDGIPRNIRNDLKTEELNHKGVGLYFEAPVSDLSFGYGTNGANVDSYLSFVPNIANRISLGPKISYENFRNYQMDGEFINSNSGKYSEFSLSPIGTRIFLGKGKDDKFATAFTIAPTYLVQNTLFNDINSNKVNEIKSEGISLNLDFATIISDKVNFKASYMHPILNFQNDYKINNSTWSISASYPILFRQENVNGKANGTINLGLYVSGVLPDKKEVSYQTDLGDASLSSSNSLDFGLNFSIPLDRTFSDNQPSTKGRF